MSEQTEIVRGTILTKTDPAILKKSCRTLKLAVDLTDRDAMVVSLADYYTKLHAADPDKVLQCDECRGPSDASVKACPYCGVKDAEEAPAAPAAGVPVAPAKKPEKAPKADKPIKASDAKKLRIVKTGKPVDAPVVHEGEIVTTKDLDDSVAAIKSIQLGIVDGHWQLGRLLAENHSRQLHTQRFVDGTTKAKYKSWSQWVEAEIGMAPGYARELIAVSQVFTEQDIREVGLTKLRPMCRIPDEAKRANLLERAKGELTGKPMTAKEVNEETKGLARPPVDGRSPGRSEAQIKKREEREAAAKKRAAEGVTAVFQLGRITIPLWADKVGSSKGKEVRAHEVGDGPHAIEDMLNGIKVTYRLVKEAEGLSLVVERVRDKESE